MSASSAAPGVRVVVLDDRLLYRDALARVLGRVPGLVVAAVSHGVLMPPVADYDTVVVGGRTEHGVDAGARAVELLQHRTADSLAAAAMGVGAPAPPRARSGSGPEGVQLTRREIEVLRSTSAGASAREIAASWLVSPRTVERHKRAVLVKLGAQNQAEAVTRALALGLLPGGGHSTRAVVAVADALLLDLLGATLREHGVEVVGGAEDPEVLQDCCARQRPDVVLLAATLAEPDTVETAIRGLLARGIRSVLLLLHEDRAAATRLLLAGASGVVAVDDADVAAVATAMRTVAAGAASLHPEVVSLVLAQWREMQRPGPAAGVHATPTAAVEAESPAQLTERERSVLCVFAEGLTNRQVARQLGITEKTVESHKTRIFGKLGARNQAHAVQIAGSRGLLLTSQHQRSAEVADR